MKALEEWCAKSDTPKCLRILKSYLEKKTLLADMTERSHLKVKYSKETKTGLQYGIEGLFRAGERTDAPLSELFLPGYYSQRQALYGREKAPEPEPFVPKTDRSVLYGYLAAVPVSEPVSDPVPMQRDDAFGLLLAIENRVERFVMDSIQKTEKQNFRLSNAFRYLSAFDHRPWSTWTVLKEKLSPYLHRLPDGGRRKSEKNEQLETLIKENGWDSDTPLSGSCLHQFLL